MRSRFWIIFDCSMLVAFVALQAWRLTGVPLHEWLGVALTGAIVVHLALHWSWVASQFRRRRVAYALNLILFISAVAAIVSGFAISKVVLPVHPSADEYLKWHSIHETSSRVALFAAALHLALNWDRLFGKRPRLRIAFARLGMIAMATAIIIAALYGVDRAMARPDITLITPDGKRVEHAAPPADIATLRKDTLKPSARGIPPFLLQSVVVGIVAVAGRKVLRLRL